MVSVTGGTATSADYTLTGTITVPAGTEHESLVSIASGITIVDDNLVEQDETLELPLSAPSGALLGARTTHTHTIENDDFALIYANPGILVINEGIGTHNANFTLEIIGSNPDSATFPRRMGISGSFTAQAEDIPVAAAALAGVDYIATIQTIDVPVNSVHNATFNLPVEIVNDSLVESQEFFDVRITGANNINVPPLSSSNPRNRQTIVINDNDVAIVTWQVAQSDAPEGTTPHIVNAMLTINANPASPAASLAYPLTVDVNQTPITATTPDDYILTTTQVTFPAGSTSGAIQPVSITIVDDEIAEDDETFELSFGTVLLRETASNNVSASGTHVVTILDNDAFTVGGTVTGLEGDQLVLQNNGGDDQIVTANGPFAFSAQLDGTDYAVTVLTDPSNPSQTCSVSNGAGTLAGDSVTNIEVNCVTDTFSVGGTLSRLVADRAVTLQNNGGDDLRLEANGEFTFADALADLSDFEINVSAQPDGQFCFVENSSGALAGADVNDVEVNCEILILSLSLGHIQFGAEFLGQVSEQPLVLTNNGSADVLIELFEAPDAPFGLDTGDCAPLPFTLGPGQSCAVLLSFSSISVGDFQDTIMVLSSALDSPQSVTLSGSAVSPPLPVPALGALALLLLMLGILMTGVRQTRG